MDLPTDDGFAAFYRAYARTGVHAVATAALTAFGTLTILHRGFAAVALAAYALPPLVLYGRGAWLGGGEPAPDQHQGDGAADGSAAARDPASTSDRAPGWTAARPPTDADLHDVVVTDDGAVAVGEGGVVLARSEGGDEWDRSLSDGPPADGATLHGVDATADGAAVWVAGDGGAVGRRDADGRWVDHSAPGGDTNNLSGVAVAGPAGAEAVLLVDGSGGVRRGEYRDGGVAWAEPTTPGSGSSIAGVALDGAAGYVVDTAGDAFRTADGGRSFAPAGLEPTGTPTAVAATGSGPAVATSAGVVHLHDGSRWTPERVGDDALSALASDGDDALVAVGEGVVQERTGPNDWQRVLVPGRAPLHGVALGGTGAVAVGASGALVTRQGDAAPN